MRLLNPSPGEAVDRQTILELKIDAAKKKNVWAKPFGDECNALQEYLEKNWFLLAPKTIQNDYDTLFKAMKEVNKKLWILEDRIRDLSRQYKENANMPRLSEDIIQVALLIPILNDERAELVRKINALFKINSQEKLYA